MSVTCKRGNLGLGMVEKAEKAPENPNPKFLTVPNPSIHVEPVKKSLQ